MVALATLAELWGWGIRVIETIQAWGSPPVDWLMIVVTSLGTEEFYFFCFAILAWTGSRYLALSTLVLLCLSSTLNANLKELFQHPRPFDLVPGLQLVFSRGYGFPSGHAQSAVVLWGWWALRHRSAAGRLGFASMIVLIGFSRVYLGVHFPTDVLVGWLAGGVLLAAALFLAGRLSFADLRERPILPAGVTLASMLLLLLVPLEATSRLMGLLAGVLWGEHFRQPEKKKILGPFHRILGAMLTTAAFGALKWGLSLSHLVIGMGGILLMFLLFALFGYAMTRLSVIWE